MILSDTDIKKKINEGQITITPIPDLDTMVGTVSIDLRLGSDFMIYRRDSRPYVDVNDPNSFTNLTETVIKGENEPFIIHPGEFVLGATLETISLPADLAGRLEGKSSLGRLGIVIHSTAGKVDPGFNGRLVLEITNIGTLPIMLYPNMRVCQLLFEQLSSPTSIKYTDRIDAKYKVQVATTGSKMASEII